MKHTRKSFFAILLSFLAAPFCRASKTAISGDPGSPLDWMQDPEVMRCAGELRGLVAAYAQRSPRTTFELEVNTLGWEMGMVHECEDIWDRRAWKKKWGCTKYPGDAKKAAELTEIWTKERQATIQNALKAIAKGGNIT